MQESQLYEYAVLRYVPDVEREEFINIGLVMMCKRSRWIRLAVKLDERRLAAFGTIIPLDTLRAQLSAFDGIASGARDAGPIAEYPVEERFRWITAMKSACIQTSRPHPGLTTDLDSTFTRLFHRLVASE